MITLDQQTRRTTFFIGWAFGRIGQLLEERGTQNSKGEWRVVEFTPPLGAAIERPKEHHAA